MTRTGLGGVGGGRRVFSGLVPQFVLIVFSNVVMNFIPYTLSHVPYNYSCSSDGSHMVVNHVF